MIIIIRNSINNNNLKRIFHWIFLEFGIAISSKRRRNDQRSVSSIKTERKSRFFNLGYTRAKSFHDNI